LNQGAAGLRESERPDAAVDQTDAVMLPMDELVRLFADYGCEILGPPLSLSDPS
jgi:hypothetical protein